MVLLLIPPPPPQFTSPHSHSIFYFSMPFIIFALLAPALPLNISRHSHLLWSLLISSLCSPFPQPRYTRALHVHLETSSSTWVDCDLRPALTCLVRKLNIRRSAPVVECLGSVRCERPELLRDNKIHTNKASEKTYKKNCCTKSSRP